MNKDQRLILLFGNVAAQLYMIAVFIAAILGDHTGALIFILASEGLTAAGYQAQVFEWGDTKTPAMVGLISLVISVASWLTAIIAALCLL